ncbi:sushi, von Willebrand factor type A, EGF and pentraxin domain-containing protein 1-like isoform X2 [Leptopilina heterotoma]|uniref:sushi, von Willebrand factor type A, EGF and pentraxin domain-containing protein 1-like isoform X2 n=1 Tax=Leptopilina heterotoma TaxID=63436 RepID=UPI001CA7E345|nr:sushi, von Willebrand factor type A, EGF and pentraxin domain-containing protein 1-like isoform X2 [Leptopilina heterotoma]
MGKYIRALIIFLLLNIDKIENTSNHQLFHETIDNEKVIFLNYGDNSTKDNQRYQLSMNPEKHFQRKINFLAEILKNYVDQLRTNLEQVDLVFLVDASSSVGLENFKSELNFVKKLLSDFTVEPSGTRVAIVTFAGRKNVHRNVDQISENEPNSQKCQLLGKQLGNIKYTGGGTFTMGALLEALDILEKSRNETKKAVFLITDGYSNGGDPRAAAQLLKESGVTIFTFGIGTGNVEELFDIASEPGHMHSYLLDSFSEFDALARRALHRDLKAGKYVQVKGADDCDSLCEEKTNGTESCCDELATCSCGTATGHYACLCPLGYYGSGLKGFCQPCPNGTYGFETIPGDWISACNVCPDVNHVTKKVPAIDVEDCVCTSGFVANGSKCEVIKCSKLEAPDNGYFVKGNECNNVVNAACGIRCRIGFHLTGDSIRLCRNNGTWSGIEPQCLVKTCPSLKIPSHGKMMCTHDDQNEQRMLNNFTTSQPIDTRCEFQCEKGFQLRGSKVRNCLPLSRWDGLPTSCKEINCQPLTPITSGLITPEICLGPQRIPFETNCKIHCKNGYELQGPHNRTCIGRHGIWSNRHNHNQCLDKTPPNLTCPESITASSLPGKNFTFVNWTIPIASDNSELVPLVWSKPNIVFPWRAEIGTHAITYFAQDDSENKIQCQMFVNITDNESPIVENCESPPVFLSESAMGAGNVTWDEPVFYDNSGYQLKIEKSHIPGMESFPVGITKVTYNATDEFGNTESCRFNITVEDSCQDVPTPSNAFSKCHDEDKNGQVHCVITCDKGYAFVFDSIDSFQSEENLILTCNFVSHSWNYSFLPDCSVTQIPQSISQDAVAIFEGQICDNSSLLENLTESINKDLTSKLLEVCGNEIDCTLVKIEPKCETEISDNTNQSIILNRTKRFISKTQKFKVVQNLQETNDSETEINSLQHRKERLVIKFKFIGKNADNHGTNSNQGTAKIQEKLQKLSESNLFNKETKQTIENLSLNYHTMFKETLNICEPGSIMRTYDCVKCPAGTFHNLIKNYCQSCKIGDYQDSIGSIECKKCPNFTTTWKIRGKSLKDCKPLCQPGYYSHRKKYKKLGLAPCTSCEIGFFQSNYGQSVCKKCPENFTTVHRGSKSQDSCMPIMHNPCDFNLCQNGGTCQREVNDFSCDCPKYFIGSRCETFKDPCSSSPCLQNGSCILQNQTKIDYEYVCKCKTGYAGKNCQFYIDECAQNPCKNGGTCKSSDLDFHCDCRHGFEEPRANPKSYRCECPDGYTGKDCLTRINYCNQMPCKNGGKCISTPLNYTCQCPQIFTGPNCENELSLNYVMQFTKSGTTDYVKWTNLKEDLSELSVCLWIQSLDKFNYGTVLSYANQIYDNAVTLTDYNGFVFYINGQKVITDITANDGYWHFLCFTWQGSNGQWNAYLDGKLFTNGTSLSNGTLIKGDGILIVGQEQDKIGGQLSESESFIGKIAHLNLWDTVLEREAIENFGETCKNYFGNLYAWAKMRENIHGNIRILQSEFCKGCPELMAPSKGNVSISEKLEATYTCDEGYLVKVGRQEMKVLKRKCLLQGEWEGHYTPICGRVKCGFPGYFPRGHIRGRSYLFGDEINYFCNEGYELKGNVHRICNSNGEWSGQQPFCVGITCKNLLAPENGDIEYIIEEHETNDTTLLQVGQQLEFKCNSGFRLHGENILTCLESGLWDYEIPKCLSFGCPLPKTINNGYIATVISDSENNLRDKNDTVFFNNDIVGISCMPGFKFQGNHNLVAEFRLQCTSSSRWMGFVPNCVPRKCPLPKLPINGRILLQLTNKTTIEIDDKHTNSSVLEKIHDIESSLSPGTRISIECQSGFRINGNNSGICTLNETWTNDLSFCQIQKCPLKISPILPVFDKFFGKSEQVWQEKRDISHIFGNFLVRFEGNFYDDRIIFSCHNQTIFQIENRRFLEIQWKCSEDGIWNFENREMIQESKILDSLFEKGGEICETVKCTRPKISDNSYIVNDDREEFNKTFYIDDILHFKCRQGFFIDGVQYSKCLFNGSWSNVPKCQSIICENPTLPPHAELKYANYKPTKYIFGNMLIYQCIPGYRIYGQGIIRCLSNAKWSRIRGKCGKIFCGPPTFSDQLTIKGNSYFFEDQLIVTCKNGGRSAKIICKSDGNWSKLVKCHE